MVSQSGDENTGQELLCHTESCVGYGACVEICPAHAVCIQEGKGMDRQRDLYSGGRCTEVCNLNLREIAGKEYTVDDLVKELKKDEMFYEGVWRRRVTLSGGEVMLADMDFCGGSGKEA